MNGPTHTNRRTVLKTTAATLLGGSLLAGTAGASRVAPPGKARGRRNEVEIVSEHDHDAGEHRFELSTREVASGWTTFEFDNRTEHTHFAYLPRIPEQALTDAEEMGMDPLELYVEAVTRPFQWYWDTLVPDKEPEPADNTEIYDSLFPPWFGDVTFYGGPGLTSPELTSETTVDLPPGEYIVECYVKDGDNDFHSYLGMIDLLSVTGEESDAPEPESTLDLSISTHGIDAPAEVRPGRHAVAVEFENQTGYSNLVGHDVNLVRLDEETTVEDVNGWTNWADPTQFVSDGDEPTTFLGGVQDIWTADLPRTGYFHVTLKPGDYAWVAEVPDPEEKDLLAEFSVPDGRGRGGR
jgi:hypothetical protein